MAERYQPILPQVPVEGLTIHVGRAGLGMGDAVEARLLPDGRVGIFARIRQRVLGLIPVWRPGFIGHLGPVAEQILAPALAEGASFRLRIVVLTPEHLAGSGPPEVIISVWGNPARIQWLAEPALYLPRPDLPAEVPGE